MLEIKINLLNLRVSANYYKFKFAAKWEIFKNFVYGN
jgi:hypothetical protein